jgi:hypothetical protein
MDCGSSAVRAECGHFWAGSYKSGRATILPGAPDTAEPFYRPSRADVRIGLGSTAGCIRVGAAKFCDIREVCVHGCFLFTSVNT